MTDIRCIRLVDEAPEVDAMEQQHVVDANDETGLDTAYVVDIADRDADPADVIDQAIVVPVPEDD